MPTEPHSFRRLVLGLQPRAPDHAMRLAVELAELLNLELVGLFLEDTNLRSLASLPFAREFRPLGGGWHPIDTEHLSRELEAAARSAEEILAAAAKRLSWRFEVARGPMAATIAAISQTSDIVVIAEPSSAAERVTQQFSWLIEAAFKSAASVMVVPRQIARVQGPIVALATTPDDPSIGMAANIALAAHEELVVVDVCERPIDDAQIKALATGGLTIKHTVAGKAAGANATALAQVLRPLRERLVVIARSASDSESASVIAAERKAPVLVVEATRD